MDYADGVVSRIEEENEGRATGAALSKFEQRVMVTDLEIRSEDGMTLEGYAAVFNSRSENLGGFTEQIAQGAFTATLKARNDIKLLWNHDTANVLGSTRAGTLMLTEDSRGLRVKAELPDTNLGRDIAYLVRRGDIDSFSFGFSVNEDSWNSNGTERTLESVRLFEVSLVSFADVDADQLADALLKVEGGETISTEQKEMLSKVINTLSPEEAEEQGEEFDAEAWVELKKKKLEYLKKKA
jgi:HK97 family phage prohead protease